MNLVQEYYNTYDEAGRLSRDNVHRIEYITTMHFLKKHLPAGCSVLDCCAGTGAYAFPLAEAGYRVTAGDLTEKHVNIMNNSEKRGLLADVYQGNVLDMSRFADESFDSVLCFGALYHLYKKEDREKAVRECLRVLKPGGIFAFSYVNRNGFFIRNFMSNPANIRQHLKQLDDGINGVFYGMDFGEPEEMMRAFQVEEITNIGVDDHVIYALSNEMTNLSEEQFNDYIKYHLSVCAQPSIIGHSCHGLWIGRKKHD